MTPDYRAQLAALVASGILSEAQARDYLGGAPISTSEPVHAARERPTPPRKPRHRSLRRVSETE